MRWKLLGEFPDVKKCVVIAVPHTHWLDFPLGIMLRVIWDKRINYVGKKSLFKFPFGWFFRATGGIPVDRSKNQNMVDAVVKVYEQRESFRLCLAPEGTRKRVDKLKTGFYYIAKKAKVPIVMVAFDFGKKEVKVSKPTYPSDDTEGDVQNINSFFKAVKGKVPQYSFNP